MSDFLLAFLTEVELGAFWACISHTFDWHNSASWASNSLVTDSFLNLYFLQAISRTVVNLVDQAWHHWLDLLLNNAGNLFIHHVHPGLFFHFHMAMTMFVSMSMVVSLFTAAGFFVLSLVMLVASVLFPFFGFGLRFRFGLLLRSLSCFNFVLLWLLYLRDSNSLNRLTGNNVNLDDLLVVADLLDCVDIDITGNSQ